MSNSKIIAHLYFAVNQDLRCFYFCFHEVQIAVWKKCIRNNSACKGYILLKV